MEDQSLILGLITFSDSGIMPIGLLKNTCYL